jgi:hypothetical protein
MHARILADRLPVAALGEVARLVEHQVGGIEQAAGMLGQLGRQHLGALGGTVQRLLPLLGCQHAEQRHRQDGQRHGTDGNGPGRGMSQRRRQRDGNPRPCPTRVGDVRACVHFRLSMMRRCVLPDKRGATGEGRPEPGGPRAR